MCDTVETLVSCDADSSSDEVAVTSTQHVLCCNFNQDFSSLCLGTATGYQIYDLVQNDDLQQSCSNVSTNCVIVQRLYSSSLVAVVSEVHPRRLSVNHFKKNSHICSYTYVMSILAVLLNRERLVVVCEDRISIHVVKDMEMIHTITDTPANVTGVCALANSTTNCFLAYPASTTEGVVQVFDAFGLKAVVHIAAHESPLQCVAFDDQGTKLATASIKGTVIRVFDVTPSGLGVKLYELRRGMTRSATIHSLTFSAWQPQFLLASSNTATIHVFRLQPPVQAPEDASYTSTMYSLLSSAVSASAAYLPSQVAGMMVQERAFAWAALPSEGNVTKVALTRINKVPRVVVATLGGMVYIYNFSAEDGGECKLVRQHNLSPSPPDETTLSEQPSLESGLSTAADAEQGLQKAMQPPSMTTLSLDDPEQFPPV